MLSTPEEFRLNIPPITDERIAAGRKIFEKSCLNCHKANGYGAKNGAGPELIAGTSITQLWPREKIKEYIVNPQSVRPFSKMPPQYESADDRENVVLFIEHYTEDHQVKSEDYPTHMEKLEKEQVKKENN